MLLEEPNYVFPHSEYRGSTGMTLRDYFAAKAMQGLVTSPQFYDNVNSNDSCAMQAYEIADAMIKHRAPKEDNQTPPDPY